MKYEIIVLAAGQGKRMKAGRNKQFLTIQNVPLIIHTLQKFEQDPWCSGIVLVVNEKEVEIFEELLTEYPIQKVQSLTVGGDERQHSVYNGLKSLKQAQMVLIHDGARPFVQQNTIHELVEKAASDKAAVLAVPVKDTIKRVEQGTVIETVERSSLWAIQTPQAFLFDVVMDAHEKAKTNEYLGTDDASLVEKAGQKVSIVEGNYDNIKLTTPEDLLYAEAILTKLNMTEGVEK
ncbi:2-C-methyl-D-erythritol 4-phosphate cytidylyltransferase [Priestia megaterium]|uniref:2-C-methyl-D-erythritol 4-phosphate cytidylyltransferase n=1 Tax=Priestia megaterium TaxID=1404 RepID=UPI000CA30775|nr:2-C-methyl-D-erythritol 4-phosphate cytidylyltransferase [Priestia megaterium]AUO12045.1 2-C-methyl-D-erythritol 4-phosphate cytidylyltransferase [Priestia megaterium]PVE63235.1 2-C-methyl-D-erythritol 4-phosphate cytidylyltransferase [Priestia megaterium]PVE79661.1 2-C-methyl-D-erythritol 4-phosphate cytidylyltransferase [Priestia megaterium]PVE82911.1 2-C-methyl-D-erythritol 4-phosphate cytidylyltransferase [Priestia megaterium]PVE95439.1 2-C-methyl-D-erythritol 4-phosphate cytidylyltrans